MEYLEEFDRFKMQVKKQLLCIARNKSEDERRKRIKLNCSDQIKVEKFENTMRQLKFQWKSLLENMFQNLHDISVYDKFAYDLIRIFVSICNTYEIDADNLSYAIRCLLIPVIGYIMDECEISKRSYERQKIRKYFLIQLLTVKLPEMDSSNDEPDNDSDESIDVCSPDLGSPCRRRPGEERKSRLRVTTVTIHMLDALFDALTKHTQLVTRDDFNTEHFKQHVYHIINITHIVIILANFFDSVRDHLDDDVLYGPLPNSNMELLGASIEKFERKLVKDLACFDKIDRWTIFWSQLNSLSNKVSTIKMLLLR